MSRRTLHILLATAFLTGLGACPKAEDETGTDSDLEAVLAGKADQRGTRLEPSI